MKDMILGRVAFTIFGLEIYWYGIIMAFAILVAFFLALWLAKKRGIKSDFVFEMLLATVVFGVLFARLFSVLFEDGSSILDYFNFRSGGLSILGAVTGGAIGIGILCLIRKKNFFDLADIVAVVLILAQAIGRWGNFANQELYGAPVLDKTWQFFPYAVYIDEVGGWFQALFFYEMVLNLLGFGLLLFLFLKCKRRMLTTGVYLAYYGTIRAILEPMRDQNYILRFKGIPVSFSLSIFMIAIGVSILIYVLIAWLKERKIDGQKYNKNTKKNPQKVKE